MRKIPEKEIEKQIPDYSKYITTPEFNNSSAGNFGTN